MPCGFEFRHSHHFTLILFHNAYTIYERNYQTIPIVFEKHIISINGVEYLVKGMDWTASIGEAITDTWLKDDVDEILAYIKEQDED